MSMWKRLKRVVRSQANAALDKLESPKAELDLLEEELREEKIRGRSHLADAIVELKRMEKSVQKAREEVQSWEEKAMRAVELGDDDLARQILAKKIKSSQALQDQEEGLAQHRASVEELKQHQKMLEERIDIAQQKRKTLQAKLQGARVKESVGQTLSVQSEASPLAEFERVTREIETMEAQVEINKELHNEIAAQDIEQKLRQLEKNPVTTKTSEDPLAALKAKMKRNQDS